MYVDGNPYEVILKIKIHAAIVISQWGWIEIPTTESIDVIAKAIFLVQQIVGTSKNTDFMSMTYSFAPGYFAL